MRVRIALTLRGGDWLANNDSSDLIAKRLIRAVERAERRLYRAGGPFAFNKRCRLTNC